MWYEVTRDAVRSDWYMKWFWYEVTGNRSDERYQQQTQQGNKHCHTEIDFLDSVL